MFRNLTRALRNTRISYSTQKDSTNTPKSKWDLITAVCLERKPVIVPPMNEFEEKFHKYITRVEYERSLKSDHEMRHELEVKQLELLKKGGAEVDMDLVIKNTAQDFVDACTEELSKFEPADVVTEDDKKNNMKSLNRKLSKHLVLVVNEKLGNKDYFLLPQTLHQDGETLKQAAQRVLNEKCGPDVKAQFYGNSPCGFYKYKYPENVRSKTGALGAKVFFYIARHQSGQLPEKASSFKWLDRKELYDTLPPKYNDSVAQFLIDED